MINMWLSLGLGLVNEITKVKDILFGNLHTEDARNLVSEDGGYLILQEIKMADIKISELTALDSTAIDV